MISVIGIWIFHRNQFTAFLIHRVYNILKSCSFSFQTPIVNVIHIVYADNIIMSVPLSILFSVHTDEFFFDIQHDGRRIKSDDDAIVDIVPRVKKRV